MILRTIDLDKLGPQAHKALDKTLKKTHRFTKKMNFELDLKQLFDIDKLPTVFITGRAADKMKSLVKSCPKEIGWHCTVDVTENEDGSKTYALDDVLVYPQEVTGGTTKATDDVGMWYMQQPDEIFNRLRMQGHSHVDFGITPSATDQNYYQKLMAHVTDFYIFIIFNKKGQYYIELHDIERGIIFEKADINLVYEEDPIEEWADIQMERYLIDKQIKPTGVQVGPRPGVGPYIMTEEEYEQYVLGGKY